MQENPNVYFSELLPEIFYEYLSELSDEELEKIKYDLIIMDEGQDILKPLYLYSLDTLLRGGFANGDLAVFYDEKQNIYNPDYNDGMEILHGYNCTEFKLFVNCRNTVQIGTYSSKISGIDLGEFIRENGEEVQNISYEDDDDFKKKITGILKNLRKEKVDIRDVVFLAPKKYKNSNMCIFGTSGAGKSFYTKLLILRYKLLGIKQYIIDPDREYNKICEKLKGVEIKLGPTSNTYINVLEIRKESIEDGENGYLAIKISKLIGFFNLIFGELDEEEKALLEEKLIQVYKLKNINFDDKSLYNENGEFKNEIQMPILGDLFNILGQDERTKKFKIKLIPFVEGSMKFFNNYSNIKLIN